MAKDYESAWIVGTDAVVEWYSNLSKEDHPYFSVWSKQPRVLKFSFDGETIAEGVGMLISNLEPAEDNGMNTALTIRLHKTLDKGGVINDRSPYWASIDFRLVPVGEYQGSGMAGYEARLRALESGEGREPKEEGGFMGVLNGILQNEHMQPVIAQVVSGIIGKIMTAVGPQPAAPMPAIVNPAINGIAEDGVTDPCLDALERLEKIDPEIEMDLSLLANMAEKDPAMFKMIVQQLRANYGTQKG